MVTNVGNKVGTSFQRRLVVIVCGRAWFGSSRVQGSCAFGFVEDTLVFRGLQFYMSGPFSGGVKNSCIVAALTYADLLQPNELRPNCNGTASASTNWNNVPELCFSNDGRS